MQAETYKYAKGHKISHSTTNTVPNTQMMMRILVHRMCPQLDQRYFLTFY